MDSARLAAFVAAVDAGTLSLAAKRLGAQLSTISRQVADLERLVGATLLERTGRGVRTTAEGERFLPRARHILAEIEAATAEARGSRLTSLARLRLSATPDLSMSALPGVLAELARRYPELEVEACADVRRVAVVEEEYDAVLRLGRLRDSDLVARRVGHVSRIVCAAPGFAAKLDSLAALGNAEFVRVTGVPTELSGTSLDRTVRVTLRGRIRVASFLEAAEIAARSERAVVLPGPIAAAYLRAGRLVRPPAPLDLASVDVQLLHPARHRGSPVLRDLGDLLAAALADLQRDLAPPRT